MRPVGWRGPSAAYREAVAAIDRSRTIAADPQAVWDVLADFGSISSWADNIDHSCVLVVGSEPLGTTRRETGPGPMPLDVRPSFLS